MRKSRSEAAETRQRIISTASKLFLDNGLEPVGLRDIMTAAGLTPGGFYRHFASKEQLIAESIQMAFDRLFAMFESQTLGMQNSEAVWKIVSLYLQQQSQREGNSYLCPLSSIGAEISHCNSEVREAAAKGQQRLVQLIADRLNPLDKARAGKLASGIVSTMVGAVTRSNMAADNAASRTILSDAQALIKMQFSAGEAP